MKEFYEAEAKTKSLIHDAYYLNSIKSMLKGIKYNNILEVGCGDGEVLNFLPCNASQKYGIDISPTRLKNTSKKYPNINIREENITDIKFPDNFFDLVIAIEVLEHIPDLHKAFSEMIRVSNKYILVQVPYNEIIVTELCPNCLEPIHPRGHIHSFNEDIEKLFLYHKLKIIRINYFYPALNNIILSNPLIKKFIFKNYIRRGGFISVLGEKQ